MTEAELQAKYIQLCEVLHLENHHETDSRKSRKGFPDNCTAGPHGVIWVELKGDRRGAKATPEQEAWIAMLVRSGQTAYVAYPKDWPRIQADLLRIAGKRLAH